MEAHNCNLSLTKLMIPPPPFVSALPHNSVLTMGSFYHMFLVLNGGAALLEYFLKRKSFARIPPPMCMMKNVSFEITVASWI